MGNEENVASCLYHEPLTAARSINGSIYGKPAIHRYPVLELSNYRIVTV